MQILQNSWDILLRKKKRDERLVRFFQTTVLGCQKSVSPVKHGYQLLEITSKNIISSCVSRFLEYFSSRVQNVLSPPGPAAILKADRALKTRLIKTD